MHLAIYCVCHVRLLNEVTVHYYSVNPLMNGVTITWIWLICTVSLKNCMSYDSEYTQRTPHSIFKVIQSIFINNTGSFETSVSVILGLYFPTLPWNYRYLHMWMRIKNTPINSFYIFRQQWNLLHLKDILHGSKYLVLLPLHFPQAVLCLQSILLENYGIVAFVLEDAWNIAGNVKDHAYFICNVIYKCVLK